MRGGQPIRVCVFTSSRAEYGLLVPLIRALIDDADFELQLIAAGTHLSLLHSATVAAIEADGFHLDAKIEMVLASDSPTASAKSVGLCVIDLAHHFERLRPDFLVLLGDRFELLAAAATATLFELPIVHIHGGEITEGALDDSVRHAVTKLAHLHFVAAQEFKERVLQLGESPSVVHLVGAPSVETVRGMVAKSPAELAVLVGHSLDPQPVMVTYHPSTRGAEHPGATMRAILESLVAMGEQNILVTLPNADPNFSQVHDVITEIAARDSEITVIPNLGHVAYLSLLRLAKVIVGNSSAGIIEAPILGTPSINVGSRQDGRPRATCVIDSAPDAASVSEAVSAVRRLDLADPTLWESPYEHGISVAASILDVLRDCDSKALLKKVFADHTRDNHCE